MRSVTEVEAALQLVDAGLSDAEIGRRLEVPRRTISDWRRYPDRARARWASAHFHDFGRLPTRDYCYLLGLYLGDGCISPSGRTWRLRITLDAAYPRILLACGLDMEMVMPGKRANWYRRTEGGCVDVSMWSSHWPCLFPQHGKGRKHEREIALVSWQQELVARGPRELLCGLIHSDGCRIIARYQESGREKLRPRYVFSNLSAGIRDLFCTTCDQLGVEWTTPNSREIAIARAASVARLDAFIGPKR